MYPISLETQRKLMYIPIVNIANLFILVYNSRCLNIKPKTTFMVFPYLFGYTIPVALFWGLLMYFLPGLRELLYLCSLYTTPLCMSFGILKYEEKYLADKF